MHVGDTCHTCIGWKKKEKKKEKKANYGINGHLCIQRHNQTKVIIRSPFIFISKPDPSKTSANFFFFILKQKTEDKRGAAREKKRAVVAV